MSEKLFVNPIVPYCGLIPDGLGVNKMVRIQGVADRNGDRFDINLQTGRSTKPRDDTVLHLSVRLKQGYIARNSYQSGTWGDEQGAGPLPIGAGLQFEILILADLHDFKIAVNGQHFCEFPQRFSLEQVSYLVIQGDVHLTLISWEESLVQPSAPLAGGEHANQSSPMSHGPPPMAPGYGAPGYGPPPSAPGYGPPTQHHGGYGPPPPPGQEKSDSGFHNFMEQAQSLLAGAIASGAANRIIDGLLHPNHQQQPGNFAPDNARYGHYPSGQSGSSSGGGGIGSLGGINLQSFLGGASGGSGGSGQGSMGGLGGFGSILSGLADQVMHPKPQQGGGHGQPGKFF